MPGCRVETKRRGIDLGLIAVALLRSATVARAGGRGRVTLCAGPAPCGDGLWQREGLGGRLACGHAAPASAAASYQATKKEVPTYSPIFEDVDGLEQAAPNTTIHVKIPFSVSMRQPARSRPETTDNRVDFDGHGIRGIDLPAPGKWLRGLKSRKINHLHYITRR